MDEILRALDALQVADANKVALPLDWKRGDRVIVPPPLDLDGLNERVNGTYDEKVDFYLVKKNL